MMDALANGASIIDVRTPGEYKMGNISGSVNIPLNKMNEGTVKKLKRTNNAVVVCCASGARSAQATQYLKANGVEAYNGGSWYRVNRMKAS